MNFRLLIFDLACVSNSSNTTKHQEYFVKRFVQSRFSAAKTFLQALFIHLSPFISIETLCHITYTLLQYILIYLNSPRCFISFFVNLTFNEYFFHSVLPPVLQYITKIHCLSILDWFSGLSTALWHISIITSWLCVCIYGYSSNDPA